MLQNEIRRLRKAKGMTQKELADKLHIMQHALSQYETGKRTVSLEMFENILQALDVRIEFKIPDQSMKMQVMASLFFEDWNSMEERFPDWEVFHSGGGIWILQKDFVTKQGEQVMVSVADTGAMLYKKLTKDDSYPYGVRIGTEHIPFSVYKEEDIYAEYEDLSFDVLFQVTNDGWKFESLANDVFEKDTIEELVVHANLLNEL